MTVRVFPSEARVADAAAAAVVTASREAIAARGTFRLALAGGSTPRLAYEKLADVPGVDWAAFEVFFGDDRAVAPDAEGSNFKMAEAALLSRVPIPNERIHRIFGELGAREAAVRYEAELGTTPLDLVLLGMGGDGHTASLFPDEADGTEPRRVVAAKGPPPHTERITLTLRALAEARSKVFLVTGTAKAARLAEVLYQVRSGAPILPAARACAGGVTVWLIDSAAAANLTANDRPHYEMEDRVP